MMWVSPSLYEMQWALATLNPKKKISTSFSVFDRNKLTITVAVLIMIE